MFVSFDTVKAGYRVVLAAAATACVGGGFYIATRYFGPEKRSVQSIQGRDEKKPVKIGTELGCETAKPQSEGS